MSLIENHVCTLYFESGMYILLGKSEVEFQGKGDPFVRSFHYFDPKYFCISALISHRTNTWQTNIIQYEFS
ncbi:hypothetical protein GCM10008014_16670 [Paenibacillus silvae]|uniref:Uncharacterized protein n=1 Tax=Paenibacillus silvae TaxID=1325358 RepID=A0ABQ1Z5M5_9BACL|nr:hypothetical protein GCM10008014_16670 [Paenibacillus silvae]